MVWMECWNAIREEFADLGDAGDVTRVLVRLLMAMLMGGLLGFERESAKATAGLRTHMLVALGAALFVLVPQQAGMDLEGVSRVMQGLTAGIGFLGAGAILKQNDKGRIQGLTTAANVWLTAAIGMAAGMGREATALVSTVCALVVLALVRWAVKDRNESHEEDANETDETETPE
ncbi:MgtC/SapB family protein [Massilia sp. 9096]|uniref:MgtC/SapB family protein n=1 Tax=Massilia sp. 9096 TaxID=1500894 RepID=UPI00068F09D6|nr:MgtC/SapB family protein [Massilia sp. 9096]